MATSSRSDDVTLWDLGTGQEIYRRDKLSGMRGRLEFNRDGSLLAASPLARIPKSFRSKGVIVLETATGKIRMSHPGRFSSAISFDPAGRRLAAGDQKGKLWLWDPETGDLQQQLPITNGWITDIAFLRGGSQVLVGDVGGKVLVWDFQLGRPIKEASLPAGLFRLAVDPQERLAVAANFLGEVFLLDLPDFHVRRLTQHSDQRGTAMGLAFRPDGKWLAVGGADGRVTIWDVSIGERVFALPSRNVAVLDLAFHPGDDQLAVATADEMIALWDVTALETGLRQLGLLDVTTASPPRHRPQSAMEERTVLRRIGIHELVSPEWYSWLMEHALETYPEQSQMSMELAWFHVMGPKVFRDPDAALPLALRAVQLEPRQPDCLNTLGAVYYRLGRWDDAIQALHEAIQHNPDGASGYDLLFLAMSYQRCAQPDAAKANFEQALEWYEEASLNAWQTDEFVGLFAEAELVLEKCRDPEPAAAVDHLVAGRAFAELGKWTRAARHFGRATELSPDDPGVWAQLGQAHAHLGQWAEAVRSFGRAVELSPDHAEYHYHHAVAHLGGGDLDSYQRSCAEMMARFQNTSDPGIASQTLYACLPLQHSGIDPDELVRLAEIAVPWFRGNGRVHGASLYRAGEFGPALQHFDEMTELRAPKGWDLLFRAMAHARLDHTKEARDYFQKAVTWIDQAERIDMGDSPQSWVDWFEREEVRLLRREAEHVLNEPGRSSKD